ncbi:hypothetical protein F511_31801 [Dorcoceras hygrometricum]|uniref:Uncharacterized protein n=1 Tax=Dorcoceras hygrometricum TaxID=472368 RepID=A0A2Z7AFZ8_9LAMI|nr:hypothetical protein F511_31801 [Dorcoceras hygrometricum]
MGACESHDDASTCQKQEAEKMIKKIAVVAGISLAAWGLFKLVDASESERKTMKAPGRNYRIFRDDFERDPALHFRSLRD